MAYSSNTLKKTWTYDYGGDTHNDRIGRLLSGGHDLRMIAAASYNSTKIMSSLPEIRSTTTKAEAAQQANYLHDLEKEQARGGSGGGKNGAALNQSATNSKAATPDTKGLVWVDEKGNTLGPCSTARSDKETVKLPGNLDGLNERQIAATTMKPVERSMDLWRKLQPGVMESTTKLPKPTMKDHFQYDSKSAFDVDHRHHFKKSDFSEYIENKLKPQTGRKNGLPEPLWIVTPIVSPYYGMSAFPMIRNADTRRDQSLPYHHASEMPGDARLACTPDLRPRPAPKWPPCQPPVGLPHSYFLR
eukprot:gene21018-27883_t